MALALPARAQAPRAEAVLVLEAASPGWKAGVQSLVAELLTKGYELRVRSAGAGSSERLEHELRRQVTESGAFAGVTVVRHAGGALAVLCRDGVVACERVQVEASEDELLRSRLALAVVERLRSIDLPSTAAPSAPADPRGPGPAAPNDVRPLRGWLGGGVLLSSGTSTALPWLSATLSITLAEPWGLELSACGSPLPGRADSYAGSLSLRALEGMAFVTFEPFRRRSWGLALGLGGGALHLRESASPAPGFDGFARHATVGVVSARARLSRRLGPLAWGLSLDPGMLVPALRVKAGTATVLRIGRPWVAVQTGLGIEL